LRRLSSGYVTAGGSLFKIYARSTQSLEERPIPLKLTFEFDERSESHESFKEWLKYGKPYEGEATLESDLPGGLGSQPSKGRVMIWPSQGDANTGQVLSVL
jgi:hypothetical protein